MVNNLQLPLVDFLAANYKNLDFSRVKIIGVQHILETTHALFRSLYGLGLKPENVSIIGKCYSTCREVYEEMKKEGIYVSSASFAYNSHTAFDDQFAQEIKQFLFSLKDTLISEDVDLIIVLDDGGKCITSLGKDLLLAKPIIGIEQTSSGYQAIRSKKIDFPIFNVARSSIKLRLESPMIAQAAGERLFDSLKIRGLSPAQALVVGGGPIGQAMKKRLSTDMDVTIYDPVQGLSCERSLDFPDCLREFPLIVGCTGKTSVPHEFHSLIAPETALVSVSSSDREFDAVHLRRLLQENHCCHEDIIVRDFLLVRSGFPVNFDGERENIEPDLIQLTLALIMGGILEARLLPSTAPRRLLSLSSDLEKKIENKFAELAQQPNFLKTIRYSKRYDDVIALTEV